MRHWEVSAGESGSVRKGTRGGTRYFYEAFEAFQVSSDPRAFERDRRRWQQVQEVGWTITWVTRQRLDTDLAGILAEVDAAHVRAGLS